MSAKNLGLMLVLVMVVPVGVQGDDDPVTDLTSCVEWLLEQLPPTVVSGPRDESNDRGTEDPSCARYVTSCSGFEWGGSGDLVVKSRSQGTTRDWLVKVPGVSAVENEFPAAMHKTYTSGDWDFIDGMTTEAQQRVLSGGPSNSGFFYFMGGPSGQDCPKEWR